MSIVSFFPAQPTLEPLPCLFLLFRQLTALRHAFRGFLSVAFVQTFQQSFQAAFVLVLLRICYLVAHETHTLNNALFLWRRFLMLSMDARLP